MDSRCASFVRMALSRSSRANQETLRLRIMATHDEDDALLTVAECADRLGLFGIKSRTFVRDSIKAGDLQAYVRQRNGRTYYRVKPSDLQDFIDRTWRYTALRRVK